MDLLSFQKGIKDLVASDKLEEALDLIIQFSQGEDGYDALEKGAIINRGKLDRIEREKIEDRIDPEDFTVQKSQVSAAILTIIDELKPQETVQVPNSSDSTPIATPASQEEIQQVIVSHDKIFIKIILAVLAVSMCLFVYFIFQENYGGGGAFFTSSAGTCYIYLNNKKQLIQSLQTTG